MNVLLKGVGNEILGGSCRMLTVVSNLALVWDRDDRCPFPFLNLLFAIENVVPFLPCPANLIISDYFDNFYSTYIHCSK